MAPLSAKERQRRRREKLKSSGQYDIYKVRNTQYSREYRQKQKQIIQELPAAEKACLLEEKRENDRNRKKKSRERQRNELNMTLVQPTTLSAESPAYSAQSSLNQAANKVCDSLPNSPRKKRALIRKLATDFSVSMKSPEKKSRIAEQMVSLVQEFYQRDDISLIPPGERDAVTVRGSSGKTKLQKRYLVMNMRETYLTFKEENANVNIDLSKFTELRPVNVLPCSQTPSNMCLCTHHQNFIMALDSLHGYVPSIPPYTKDFSASCLVSPGREECWFGTCEHDGGEKCGFGNMYFLPDDSGLCQSPAKWMKWVETNGHLIKNEQTGTIEDLFNYAESMAPAFLKHCFIERMQSISYEADKTDASRPDSTI
ncbi:hypothetical protein GJAV_G00105720 [Gymnothorax javanicus]|nr:hypothetical protein GJAV_G00105720 [Gymnothorax javanicus]